MSYTNGLDKPSDHFSTKLYTGTGSSHAVSGINFQPDWVWIKCRDDSHNHQVFDSNRGIHKRMRTDTTGAETESSESLKSFDSDGFTLGTQANVNNSSNTFVSWNWLAGGTAPAITYSVKVVSDSGNKYRFDDFGTSAVTLDLQEGGTYTFDQSDSSNSGHPLRFSTTSDGTHGGGSEYTTNVTTTGTPGSAGAKTVITVAASAPTLYYYCTQHSGMGGQVNTNSTHGSSNFDGTIQSKVTANVTAGFSVVSWTGNATAGATVGHGLGATPDMFIVKVRNADNNWAVYHKGMGETKASYLDGTSTQTTDGWLNNTAPTSTVFTLSGGNYGNTSGNTHIAFCMSAKKGYSSISTYVGNGNSDGAFVYTGHRPAYIFYKNITTTDSWFLHDNKRQGYNDENELLFADLSNVESTVNRIRILANGFKALDSDKGVNKSGDTYIYWSIAEFPFVTSTKIPTPAR